MAGKINHYSNYKHVKRTIQKPFFFCFTDIRKVLILIVFRFGLPIFNQIIIMKYIFKNNFDSYIAIVCSLLLLIAIFVLPNVFYTFLRIFIFLGAIIIGSKAYKTPFILFSFALIAYLFNPIIPVYLFQKSIWLPVDIICALLFALTSFDIKKYKPYIPYSHAKKKPQAYGRDKKY